MKERSDLVEEANRMVDVLASRHPTGKSVGTAKCNLKYDIYNQRSGDYRALNRAVRNLLGIK